MIEEHLMIIFPFIITFALKHKRHEVTLVIVSPEMYTRTKGEPAS
jgi:hypothetical protein